jgi:hypothetical protein
MKQIRASFTGLILISALPASAQNFYAQVPSGIDLVNAQAAPLEGAALSLFDSHLQASHGIRLESVETFSASVPIVLDTPYVVRDAQGMLFRVWVYRVQGQQRKVAVAPYAQRPVDFAALQGRFRTTSFRVNGQESGASQPDLRLYRDGTYRLGGASGRWEKGSASTVAFDGYYANWGRAVVAHDGQSLKFKYTRGQLTFELVYSRVSDIDTLASAEPPKR